MEKKALIILFGGRSMPNILSIIHEKPQLIIPIISEDAQDALPLLEVAVEKLFEKKAFIPKLDKSYVVDAFDWRDVKEKCLNAVINNSNLDWTFNITSATAIMSIGAFEAAKDLLLNGEMVRCWYLNTSRSKVVPLVGDGRDAGIFDINVEDYVTACYCSFGKGKIKDDGIREICQNYWLSFAKKLGKDYKQAELRKEVLKEVGGSPSSKERRTYHLKKLYSNETYELLEAAQELGLLDKLEKNKFLSFSFRLTEPQYSFLNGTWLEVYAWHEAKKIGIFNDVEWGREVTDRSGKSNEFDTAMIYKAQLIAAECKTDGEPFKTEYLYKLETIINALGSNFVSTLFITSASKLHDSYEGFRIRAEGYGIRTISGEELDKLGYFLAEQATKPLRKRI